MSAGQKIISALAGVRINSSRFRRILRWDAVPDSQFVYGTKTGLTRAKETVQIVYFH